ncbi:MAG: carbohydrate kinase family protein [Geodermatophilaceae bacterium]|nr:carbohydrate kinase family protein [Geodermatophilaceae bacterium]
MRIAVTGSIATDNLMHFPGKFTDMLVGEQLNRLSLSFLVDDMVVRQGGIAANITYGMAQLGLSPLLVGAVGRDFGDYLEWLGGKGVDCGSVLVSTTQLTAQFICTTDDDMNQLASFYPGAMSEARDIDLLKVSERAGMLDLVLISPNDPEAMVAHTEQCRDAGIDFMADPSQQLARLDGEQIRSLVEDAAYLVTNDYEKTLLEQKTGWTSEEVLDRVGVRVVTLGEQGVEIHRSGEPVLTVPIAREVRKADPTGVGDAFRAGFVAGLSWEVGLERAAQVGALLATMVIEVVGTQEYQVDVEKFLARLGAAYGEESATEVGQHLQPRRAVA